MANYELVPAKIPSNQREAEGFEQWLEKISAAGGDLVTILPTTNSATVLAVFRSNAPRSLESFKTWG